MAYSRFKADHRVTIFRAENGYVAEDISLDIVSIFTTKTFGMAAGGFSIVTTFNPRLQGKRYDELLKPDDVVHIELDGGEGRGLQSRMIGLVDRVARHCHFTEKGDPVRHIKIGGMDFGKLLVKHHCLADISPLTGSIGSEDVIRLAQGVQFSGSPHEMVKSVFEKLFLNQVPWAKPYFVLSLEESDKWETFDYPVLETTGPVWTAMKNLANEPFNILSTETIHGKLRVRLEPHPINSDSGKLSHSEFITINDADISFEDLGISDGDRVTYLYYQTHGVVLFAGGTGTPLQYETAIQFDADAIKKHGFRPWYPKTNFGPPGYHAYTNASRDMLRAVSERAQILWNRVKRNHELESGTINVKGNPAIRAGGGIVLESPRKQFLVETVADHYEWGRRYFTSMQVTRGQAHARG